ncbi:MAG: SDR family oxidoreductase [Deltaproteobacteria bacterium]|nr:SDR family oxidoreductase [Deltaproteobacteria bacterium]
MANILVTGGGGFIGSNLAEALLKRGDAVRVLDNFSTGRKENLVFPELGETLTSRLEILQGDMADREICRKAVEGIDYVLHQAAIPSVPRSVAQPVESNDANINGTLNLLVEARDAGVKRMVFASSSSVYGNTPTLPKVETITPNPLSPYAVQKLTAEHYFRIFYELYGLETVCLRYFNVFGPRQDPNSEYSAVIPKFIKALLAGTRPTIFGDGEQSRDFTHVDNVVYGNFLALEAPKAAGKAMNLACGGRLTLNELLAILNKIIGSDIEPIYADPRPGDVKHSHADISLSEDLLGYKMEVSTEEGLARTVDYFKEVFA